MHLCTLMPAYADLLSVEQADAVAEAVQTAVVSTGAGTLVDIARINQTARSVCLEVTLFRCRQNATVPSPDCEIQVLEAVLEQLTELKGTKEAWERAGEEAQQSVRLANLCMTTCVCMRACGCLCVGALHTLRCRGGVGMAGASAC